MAKSPLSEAKTITFFTNNNIDFPILPAGNRQQRINEFRRVVQLTIDEYSLDAAGRPVPRANARPKLQDQPIFMSTLLSLIELRDEKVGPNQILAANVIDERTRVESYNSAGVVQLRTTIPRLRGHLRTYIDPSGFRITNNVIDNFLNNIRQAFGVAPIGPGPVGPVPVGPVPVGPPPPPPAVPPINPVVQPPPPDPNQPPVNVGTPLPPGFSLAPIVPTGPIDGRGIRPTRIGDRKIGEVSLDEINQFTTEDSEEVPIALEEAYIKTLIFGPIEKNETNRENMFDPKVYQINKLFRPDSKNLLEAMTDKQKAELFMEDLKFYKEEKESFDRVIKHAHTGPKNYPQVPFSDEIDPPDAQFNTEYNLSNFHVGYSTAQQRLVKMNQRYYPTLSLI